MKTVFLDTATLGKSELKLPWPIKCFKQTKPSEILENIGDAAIVITNKVILTEEILKKCANLKLICIAATGTNNVDLEAAKRLNITVCNIPNYSTPSVSQLTMTFILALATNLFSYASDVKSDKWQKAPQFVMLDHPITELKGKSLGIIGYGTLGKEVAKLAEAFGMHVIKGTRNTPLLDILKQADFVSIHVPLTAETKNLITRKEIEQMKKTAYLINTARGGIVNEKDLADCLKEKKIAGAALDVLTVEPPTNGNPLLERDIPNLLITPHVGWASKDSIERLLQILSDNISAFIKGSAQNVVV